MQSMLTDGSKHFASFSCKLLVLATTETTNAPDQITVVRRVSTWFRELHTFTYLHQSRGFENPPHFIHQYAMPSMLP